MGTITITITITITSTITITITITTTITFILKGAGRLGQLRPDFFSKMDFTRPPVSQHFSNDKDQILQDVSSLPFYPKIDSVDSLFRIPTFFCWTDFLPTNSKKPKIRFFKTKKNAAGRSI